MFRHLQVAKAAAEAAAAAENESSAALAGAKITLDDLPDEATVMAQLGFGGFASTKVRLDLCPHSVEHFSPLSARHSSL